jgi:hypothetical protein
MQAEFMGIVEKTETELTVIYTSVIENKTKKQIINKHKSSKNIRGSKTVSW